MVCVCVCMRASIKTRIYVVAMVQQSNEYLIQCLLFFFFFFFSGPSEREGGNNNKFIFECFSHFLSPQK